MTLPLRVGVRATQLWLRAAEETVAVVAGVSRRVIGQAVSSDGAPSEPIARAPEPASETMPPPSPAVAYEQPAVEWDEPAVEWDEPAAEPVHVSEQPELVEEVAEPGAEDGAGAEVHVEQPWDGYDRMKAADVIDRLAGASTAELAAVQLYETGTKGRRTVLETVERELRISTGSG
jgi:hypothetical protein